MGLNVPPKDVLWNARATHRSEFPAKNSCILKRACHPQQFLHGEAFMATAANKNKTRTFEAEIGPQNKNIEAGQNFTGS